MVVALKFVSYVTSLLVVGQTAFGALHDLGPEIRSRLARHTTAAAAIFALSAIVTIVLQVNQLLGLEGLPSLSNVALYLQLTASGRSWGWRLVLTVLAVVCLAVLPSSRRSSWTAAFALAAAAAYPAASVSHAASATEFTRLFVVLDWVHLVSVGVWFGGLLILGFSNFEDIREIPAFSRVLARFSSTAMIVVPVAVATGAFQMQNTLDRANDLVAFDYGLALLAKHLFLLPVLALAGYTMLVVKPRLAVYGTHELARRARQNVRAESLLVFGMLASTALLTNEVPPAHVGMTGPDRLRTLQLVSDPLFFLWSVAALAAGALLLRALVRSASWSTSTISGAVFVLAAFMAVSSQVVTLDTAVFRHSTDPAVIAQGRALYRENCAVCHGEEGRGDGPAASQLSPPPANLTELHFYHHSDQTVLDWISDGIPGTAMPGFRDLLTLEERKAIVSFVRQLGLSAAGSAYD